MNEIGCIMQPRGDRIPTHLFQIFKSLEKKHLKKKCDSKSVVGVYNKLNRGKKKKKKKKTLL